jgi:hypothetical protein
MPKREKSPAEFVRDYLDRNGTAYVREMSDAYNTYCREKEYPQTSYDSFRSRIYTLKQLGLIEVARRERGTAPQPRVYYTLSPGAQQRDWTDPRGQLYGR